MATKGTYVKLQNGHIYKLVSNGEHYLRMTPLDKIEDRRVNCGYIEALITTGEAKKIKPQSACEEINKLWDDFEAKWTYNSKQYKTLKKPFKLNEAKKYEFKHKGTAYDGEKYEFKFTYYLCYYHGQLCWLGCPMHYFPRVTIYKFESFDKEPSFGDSIKWVDIKHVRNVYEKNYDGKWKCL